MSVPIKINRARMARCPYCQNPWEIEMQRHLAKDKRLLFVLLFPLSALLFFLGVSFAEYEPHCATCGKELTS